MESWPGRATEAPADLLRAFADPVRRQLMERLVAGPSSTGDLALRLGLPRMNVGYHLGVLAAAGLIDLRRRKAVVRPEALTRLRCYFDAALTTAAITLPGLAKPVANTTQP